MKNLITDLQTPKTSLDAFFDITERLIRYFPEVISRKVDIPNSPYTIAFSESASSKIITRPFNKNLLISNIEVFYDSKTQFVRLLNTIKSRSYSPTQRDGITINSIMYTIAQSIGIGFDLLANPNSARKHVGNRFEELVKSLLNELEIQNEKIVLQIPYSSEEGVSSNYRCETDLVISLKDNLISNNQNINEDEVILTLKTSSKDRMGKIFLDKILLEKFLKHKIKIIGVILNDVQRKEETKISYTFVPHHFMVYWQYVSPLRGFYYVDVPQNAKKKTYENIVKDFSQLILHDIWSF